MPQLAAEHDLRVLLPQRQLLVEIELAVLADPDELEFAQLGDEAAEQRLVEELRRRRRVQQPEALRGQLAQRFSETAPFTSLSRGRNLAIIAARRPPQGIVIRSTGSGGPTRGNTVKTITRTLLGSAIAALLVTPMLASAVVEDVRPPLLPSKHAPAELAQPSNRLIVKFRDTALSTPQRDGALNRVAASMGLQAKAARRMAVGADVVLLSRKLDRVEIESFLGQLRADPAIEYAIVDTKKKPLYVPNDTLYAGSQWHYHDPVGGLRLPAAWNKSQGAGIVVAVIDTGIVAHPDLDANILSGYDFIADVDTAGDGDGRDADPTDPGDFTDGSEGCGNAPSSWHGLHVAGTVAAVTNNGVGVAGTAPLAKVVPLRVLGKCGGYTSDIADAIVWASGGAVTDVPTNPNPAEVINMSLGGGAPCEAPSQAAINVAVANGSVVVVAAGNSNSSVANFSPASCNNVISVASNDQNSVRSSFSNAGTGIDMAAGGGSPGVMSTYNTGHSIALTPSYSTLQGTSMASPHVAGVVALMQSKNPQTPAQVEAMLKLTALPLNGALCPGGCGSGKVDALRAVAAAGGKIYAAAPIVLQNGVNTAFGPGTTGTIRRYTLTTFSDLTNLRFDLLGGTGNADLFVKLGSAPTASVYDCRSNGPTAIESCVIPAATTGVWHVMVKSIGVSSGVNVRGRYSTKFFTNKTDVPALDNTPGTYAESPILVQGRVGNAPSNMLVSVKIYHTYISDLTVELVAPDGTVYMLSDEEGGSSQNLVADFTVDASSEVANGTWTLRMKDSYNLDTGHIDQWTLRM